MSVAPSFTSFHQTMSRESSNEWLGQLFDAYYLKLYRLARRLAQDPEEAQDLVQETFLRAAHSRTLPPEGSAAEAWLVRILVNLCRDRYRRSAVRTKASGLLRAQQPTAADADAAPVARLTVQAALARLSPRRRAVIVLHEIEELAVPEIARLLGVTQATVRWHLAGGRKALAKTLLGRRAARQETRS
jgi:RNA polymerase sigma-70 factor (ECF subfamily)